MINIGVGGAWKQVTPYIGVAGVWTQITGYWIGVGGAWKSMAILPISLTATPTSVSGSVSASAPTARPNVTSNSVTITVTGGSGTYTYSWSVVFNPTNSIDSTGTCAANSATAATTTFTGQSCNGTNSPGSDYYTATCVVTDTVSTATASITVPIKLTNTYLGS